MVSICRIPVHYSPLRPLITGQHPVGPLLGSKAGHNCSCPLNYTLPGFFLTRILQNYSYKYPSTHYTGARSNSRVSLHREIKDGTGLRRLKREVGADPEMVHAPRDVWVLVESPAYNNAHLGSKAEVGWVLERSCFVQECDRIHLDNIACSHMSGQNILLNLVGIRPHYLMTTVDCEHTESSGDNEHWGYITRCPLIGSRISPRG